MDMNRITRIIMTFGLLLSVSACGSSSPVRYYSLDVLETGYDRDSEESVGFGVGPLRTPDYLTRSRIVTRGSNSEVIVDDFHRWVEPVDDAIYRIVSSNLDSLIDDVVVIAFPYSHIKQLHYRAVGRIDRFDADQNGTVVLLVQWAIVAEDSDFVVRPKRARYETRASNPDDYGSIASAMSEALAEFSRDIAREFEAAAP